MQTSVQLAPPWVAVAHVGPRCSRSPGTRAICVVHVAALAAHLEQGQDVSDPAAHAEQLPTLEGLLDRSVSPR